MFGAIVIGALCFAAGMYVQKNKDNNGGHFTLAS